MKKKKTPVRRTQKERREETIKRLVDACMQSLLAVGYARTTVKEICQRAELSQGALFRFFPTLVDLVVLTAEGVAERQIADFEKRFAENQSQDDAVGAALDLLREACRAPTNKVFYELLVAARTDAQLRNVLKPGIRRYYTAIRESARRLPELASLSDEMLEVLLFAAIHLFDGESLVRSIYSHPAIEDQRLAILKTMMTLIVSGQ